MDTETKTYARIREGGDTEYVTASGTVISRDALEWITRCQNRAEAY